MNKQDYIKNKIKQHYKDKYQKEVINFNYISKRNDDVIYKIIDNLSRRAYKFLKRFNIIKSITHMELIGCSVDELKQHIKSLLKDNMTFDNYGEWEIDHIKAITLFNLNNENEMYECFNYKNLQPLWREDNIKKSNKIILDDNPKGETVVSRDV